MNILAFESSCDETAVAVVRDGRHLLADAILSQADMHALYGGVVPEIASRKHCYQILIAYVMSFVVYTVCGLFMV